MSDYFLTYLWTWMECFSAILLFDAFSARKRNRVVHWITVTAVAFLDATLLNFAATTIHGRKEIVWRCVNRVTYGTKFCHNSPSVQEEALHQTLLRAIQNLADNYTEEVAMQINGILHDLQGGTTELEELQQKLADSQQEFDRLLDMSLECDASFLDEKLKHASEEIDNLQKQVDQLTASQQKAANPNLQLTDSDFRITEYSDTLVARIIERIEVISAVRIKIEFIGGYTVTVPLQS